MRGSILVTFDELINDRGIDSFAVVVNSIDRDLHFTDSDKLYTTYVFTGDVVQFTIQHTNDFRGAIDITRIDYTTDDEGGDLGIKETIITPTISSGTTFYTATFTGSTVPSAYNFKYHINARTNPAPTPTPTPTPSTCQYYKIYNNSVITRPYGPVTIYTYIQCDGAPFGETVTFTGSGTIPISGRTYFECVSGGTVPVTISNWTAELIPGPCPPTPTPTPEVCGLPLRTVNWEIDYSYVSDLSSGFTVAEVSLTSRPSSGFCPNSLIRPVSYFNTSTYVDYTGLTNGTVWSGATIVSGQTDTTRELELIFNICYEPSSYPSIVRSGSTVKLYINDVFIKNYDRWWTSTGGLYLDTMTQCSGLTDNSKTRIYFDDVTINENDDVKILFEDNFVTPWQKNQFEYNWLNSNALTRFVTGYTFGGDYYIPEFTQTLTGYSGTYLTTLYTTSTTDLTGAQVYLRLSNSGTTDTVNTRTVKLFQNSVEQTGFTVTQTGMTIPLSPSGLTRLYTSWPTTDNDRLINNLWQINDTFVIPPSPTPTPTPTPSPTPTPAPASMRYRYIGTSTISGTTKTASNLRVNINTNFVHSGSSVNFTTSTDTTSTSTVIDNSYVGTPVDIQGVRSLNRNVSGGVGEYVTTHTATLYRNGSIVATNTDPTNYTIPLSPSQRINTYTFTGITINPGDVMEVRWRDTIIT